MNEYESMDRMDSRPTDHRRDARVESPEHVGGDASQVVARMPDLGSPAMETPRNRRQRIHRRTARRTNQMPPLKLIVGGGVVIVVLAVVLVAGMLNRPGDDQEPATASTDGVETSIPEYDGGGESFAVVEPDPSAMGWNPEGFAASTDAMADFEPPTSTPGWGAPTSPAPATTGHPYSGAYAAPPAGADPFSMYGGETSGPAQPATRPYNPPANNVFDSTPGYERPSAPTNDYSDARGMIDANRFDTPAANGSLYPSTADNYAAPANRDAYAADGYDDYRNNGGYGSPNTPAPTAAPVNPPYGVTDYAATSQPNAPWSPAPSSNYGDYGQPGWNTPSTNPATPSPYTTSDYAAAPTNDYAPRDSYREIPRTSPDSYAPERQPTDYAATYPPAYPSTDRTNSVYQPNAPYGDDRGVGYGDRPMVAQRQDYGQYTGRPAGDANQGGYSPNGAYDQPYRGYDDADRGHDYRYQGSPSDYRGAESQPAEFTGRIGAATPLRDSGTIRY